MAKWFHLHTTIPNGVILQVKGASVGTVTGEALDATAAKYGVDPRKDGEDDAALQARIHAAAPAETVELHPGILHRVSAAFWHRWMELNPSMPLLSEGKIGAAEIEDEPDDVKAVSEKRADISAASGSTLDHFAALHGVEARGPGEPDASVKARLLAAADVDAPSAEADPEALQKRKTLRDEVAAASGSSLDDIVSSRGMVPRSVGETDDAMRTRLLADEG